MSLVIAIAVLVSPTLPAQTVPHLLIPGDAYTGDTAAVSRQQWLGLYRNGAGRYELRVARLRVARVENGCSETKVVVVGVGDSTPPLILIGGVPGLHPGPVDTVFTGYKFLHPGESVSWQLRSGWYNLRAGGTATQHSTGTLFTDYTLLIGTSRDRYSRLQTIGPLRFADTQPRITWAGDLDAPLDGALDMLFQLPTGGYSYQSQLLLSSAAAAGELVGIAGRLQKTPC